MIDLKQALSILESGDWCSLRFITANILKGSGGQVVEFAKCRIARNRQSQSLNGYPSRLSSKHPSPPRGEGQGVRDPLHNLHFTRNIELPNHQLRKVHPILITHINNIRVI